MIGGHSAHAGTCKRGFQKSVFLKVLYSTEGYYKYGASGFRVLDTGTPIIIYCVFWPGKRLASYQLRHVQHSVHGS